jgi:hypothetical protein
VGCASIASNPTVQANVLAEQNKINSNKGMQLFKFYPIVRLTFGVKF